MEIEIKMTKIEIKTNAAEPKAFTPKDGELFIADIRCITDCRIIVVQETFKGDIEAVVLKLNYDKNKVVNTEKFSDWQQVLDTYTNIRKIASLTISV